jgi:anthranilate phosphoribosyltransferase
MIKEAIAKLVENVNLTRLEMQKVMEEILTGAATNSQISALLLLLHKKGETLEELTAAVEVMRKHSRRIKIKKEVILDTCGTGGDKKGSFNISTASAFVVSGAGITVAKHGNRSVSSCCGSADLLEALGIDINMDESKVKTCLEEIGIAFLFAPNFHPAMKYALPVRQEIGVRTMFNLLGPLTNPAGATHQLVGVYDQRWAEPLAAVLKNLGTVHALIVHGEDGLDEITTTSSTFVSELKDGKVRNYKISPPEFDIKYAKPDDLLGGKPDLNAQILRELLEGKTSPYRDAVLLNAGAAIYVSDKAKDIKEGIRLAEDSINSGAALKKLELLRQYSKG